MSPVGSSWTPKEVAALRKWSGLASELSLRPGYVALRASHPLDDCDLMLWIGLGLSDEAAVSAWHDYHMAGRAAA